MPGLTFEERPCQSCLDKNALQRKPPPGIDRVVSRWLAFKLKYVAQHRKEAAKQVGDRQVSAHRAAWYFATVAPTVITATGVGSGWVLSARNQFAYWVSRDFTRRVR